MGPHVDTPDLERLSGVNGLICPENKVFQQLDRSTKRWRSQFLLPSRAGGVILFRQVSTPNKKDELDKTSLDGIHLIVQFLTLGSGALRPTGGSHGSARRGLVQSRVQRAQLRPVFRAREGMN